MTRPAVTTRPLYWLAQEHGKDYTDVLNVAWGVKRLLATGDLKRCQEVENDPAYKASVRRILDGEDSSQQGTIYQLIFNRVSALVFLQSLHGRPFPSEPEALARLERRIEEARAAIQ